MKFRKRILEIEERETAGIAVRLLRGDNQFLKVTVNLVQQS